jgi:hypothetical protein
MLWQLFPLVSGLLFAAIKTELALALRDAFVLLSAAAPGMLWTFVYTPFEARLHLLLA